MKIIPEYVTTSEAAAAARVAQLTVRRWVEAGILAGGKIGNVVVVERAALESLLDRRSKSGTGSPAEAGPPDAE